MAGDEETMKRAVKIARWSIGIILVAGLITVDSAWPLIGGFFLGAGFVAVGRNAVSQPPAPSLPPVPRFGSAWRPKPNDTTARGPSAGGSPAPTPKPPRAKPKSLAQSGMWPPPSDAIDSGGGLSFTYADANGELTERRIINWKADDEYDHLFSGWCTDREEPRSFRIDRVQSWG